MTDIGLTKIEPFGILPEHLMKCIHNDKISEIYSFFDKKHCYKNGKKAYKDSLKRKEHESEQILGHNWKNHYSDRVRGFVNWLCIHFPKEIRRKNSHLSGLELAFFLKMKNPPCKNFLIIHKETYKKLYHQEQAGIISNFFYSKKEIKEEHYKKQLYLINWIGENGGKFQEALEGAYIEKLSESPYKVYIDPEKSIANFVEKSLEKEINNHDHKILIEN